MNTGKLPSDELPIGKDAMRKTCLALIKQTLDNKVKWTISDAAEPYGVAAPVYSAKLGDDAIAQLGFFAPQLWYNGGLYFNIVDRIGNKLGSIAYYGKDPEGMILSNLFDAIGKNAADIRESILTMVGAMQ
jgi:hypothetical protein